MFERVVEGNGKGNLSSLFERTKVGEFIVVSVYLV